MLVTPPRTAIGRRRGIRSLGRSFVDREAVCAEPVRTPPPAVRRIVLKKDAGVVKAYGYGEGSLVLDLFGNEAASSFVELGTAPAVGHPSDVDRAAVNPPRGHPFRGPVDTVNTVRTREDRGQN